MMEENCSDVVEMSVESEEASSRLVGPDLDLVVVAARDEEGLSSVEVDAANRAVVLLKSVNQGTHAVIPKLDGRRVEGDENPWPAELRQQG